MSRRSARPLPACSVGRGAFASGHAVYLTPGSGSWWLKVVLRSASGATLQVRRLQRTAPERIAVVTGDGRLHQYRLDDYDACSAGSGAGSRSGGLPRYPDATMKEKADRLTITKRETVVSLEFFTKDRGQPRALLAGQICET
jgi:hypothetical protein